MLSKLKSGLNWFIRGKDGRVYLAQFPNVFIIGWLVCTIVTKLVGTTPIKTSFSILSLVFLVTWSYLEITQGQSYFRRTLGVIVVILMIYGRLK